MRGRPLSSAPGWLALGVAALAVLAQLSLFDRSAVTVDEGQLLAIADRLLHGDVLYRDVYTGIFPGSYYLTALLLELFGSDVLVTRWAQLLVNAATALALWWIGLRVARPGWAALAPAFAVALVALGFPGLTMLNYSPLALVFALYALLFLLRYLESARVGDGLAAGVLLGACGLVKQNFGGLAVVAVVLGCLVARRGSALARRPAPRALLPILAGGALLGGAGLAALASAGAFHGFVRATLLSIGHSQLDAFNDPIPPIFGAHPGNDPRFVFLYTPAALFNYLVRGETLFGLSISPALRSASIRLAYGGALALLAGGGVLLAREWPASGPRPRATRVVVLFAALLFLGIFPSAIWSHLAFVLPPLLLVLAALGDRVHAWLAARRPAAGRAWAALFALTALGAAALVLRISLDVRRWYAEPLGLRRGSLNVSPDQKALLGGAVRFLQRCARPDEPVFVAPDMPLVYFLADRRNPTPFDLVIPGDVDDAPIVERLRATRTRCVVYNPRMYAQFAPFPELFPGVDRHLRTAYQRVVAFPGYGGEWWGLVRRQAPPR